MWHFRKLKKLEVLTSVLLAATALSTTISAHAAIRWGDIAKDLDGFILTMSHEEASEYCWSRHMSLPSAYHLAQLAATYGATPPIPSLFPETACSAGPVIAEINSMWARHYDIIYGKNARGEAVVKFYANPAGYNPPTELNVSLWSNDVEPFNHSQRAYALVNHPEAFGAILPVFRRQRGIATRCVAP